MLKYWFEWYAFKVFWTHKSFDLDWLRVEGLMAVMQMLTVESGWKSGSAGGMARQAGSYVSWIWNREYASNIVLNYMHRELFEYRIPLNGIDQAPESS